ncbi:1,4-alpha-glucan branching protein GlgB [Colwellia sp. MB3u-70]|uniref:1,4-alpha-glucan branching protein GlgB n=1 Tax=unclassified Colwellia TaxID=196834 RepID=UPI0015F60B48|nr:MULTISPECIES: 1,4-alpha-glucan branching protein GlgB [unclassified Colwellia]MBA6293687.1 1,4-alpha-glucan branching protein GlgB [Colwellia sp. MB3u-8]MBA6308886.1 1,4-alpha-glucan branching protein GlgB [Colwellia sp. MB3u-70]
MNNLAKSLLDNESVKAIVNLQHQDVFSVLGMHNHPTVSGLIVRTFLPGALSVEVIDSKNDKLVATLNRVDQAGLFEGKLGRRRNTFDYRLRVYYKNESVIVDDPYRYPSLLTPQDLYLFCEGTDEQTYQWMGSHEVTVDNVQGTHFVLWAPNASRVSVVGDFNFWDGRRHVMRKHLSSGVWEIFLPNVAASASYKYEIADQNFHIQPLKADPYTFSMQLAPETASKVMQNSDYQWQDQQWINDRDRSSNHYNGAVSIYEVHLGSWKRNQENNADHIHAPSYLTYRELAEQLVPYAVEMGFTHLQLMPVSEYPFDGSWGYQPIGLFAPTARFGSSDDFKFFVDCCHRAGIGLLLDWVPGHFPTDKHGTGQFDGTCLYEHQDVRKGFHPDWQTLIYNYGRAEVQSYLISNAIYWLDQFHIDGLRVDAVASMLYLDYSREAGEWLPNIHGGRENLEAIELLQQVNTRSYAKHPGVMMIAEESTAWPGVSKPVDAGGLGFGFKWNMGWMNDTLKFMARDPIHRQHHHSEMTFGLVYSFSENFVLPISHDEVVHGKGSLLNKMPGDDWQKFANLRAYYGFMWTHPGKKLLFMGCEFAQREEWNHDQSLDWHLLEHANHKGVQTLIKDLNHTYRNIPALYELDCDNSGFEWLDSQNSKQSILIYLRKGQAGTPPALVVVNLTPSSYENFSVGVPLSGFYRECLNTDSSNYGGSNIGNGGGVYSVAEPYAGQDNLVIMSVPPLATMIFEWQAKD